MNYNDPISIIEDLDPEPPRKGKGRQFWELVLGMGVLVAVIGFAIWQSVQQAAQQDNYTAGVQAMSQHNWEEAQARFTAASGYHDADRQAQVVAGKIADRDRQYDFATDYMTNERWVECLDAVRQVQDIQPGYKDTAEIEKQALYQAKLDSLTNTIALRPTASPPGLYFYDRTGWVHLPQSDAYSAVQSYTPDGHVIYDVPGEGWQPSASPTPQSGRANPSSLQGRLFMLLQLPDLASAYPLAIDPATYQLNVLYTGSKGIWAFENPYGNSSRILPVKESFSGYEGSSFIYQSYTGTLSSTVQANAMSNSTIMAIDPNSDHYLLAQWTGLAPANTITPDTITTLYVGWPGTEPIARYSIRGGSFISAQFSPDGQYALLSTYTPFTRTTEKQTMLLIDLGGGQASRKLGEVIAIIDPTQPYNTAEFSWITATFVQGGPFGGQVLLAEFDVDHYHLRLFDTTTRAEPSIDIQVPTGSKINWTAFPADPDTLLVAGQDSNSVLVNNAVGSLRFVAITTNKPPLITKLTVRVTAMLDDAAILSGRLIYSIYDYGGAPDSQHSRSVLTLPLDHFSIKGRRPETTYKEIIANGQYFEPTRGAYNFRPGTFAYITANALHARTYSGDVDVTLEPGVTRLYNPDLFFTNRTWLR